MSKYITGLIIGLIFILATLFLAFKLMPKNISNKTQPSNLTVKKVEIASDFKHAKIKKDELIKGCAAGKDCIPSIDNPNFETASQSNWLDPEDIIFALDYQGIQRAYPQRILNWHEIVNDKIGDDHIIITFCPLCGSAVAFTPQVNSTFTQFGVSGFLHNSDLVMYDRLEGNLWQQITGEAIVGPAAKRNEVLEQIPIITTTWSSWKSKHPQTQVLSRNTGFTRNYNQYPYGTYESDDQLLFGVKNQDNSLPLKTVVYGIELNGLTKAYPQSNFENNSIVKDQINGISIIIEKLDSGQIKVTRTDTNQELIPLRLFWFAWAAFNPDTLLYKN